MKKGRRLTGRASQYKNSLIAWSRFGDGRPTHQEEEAAWAVLQCSACHKAEECHVSILPVQTPLPLASLSSERVQGPLQRTVQRMRSIAWRLSEYCQAKLAFLQVSLT